jgi:peptide chain release factor subunit 1
MLTVKDLESLAWYGDASCRHVLSVYLNVDQSRESNLNHGYFVALREMFRSMESKILPGQERQDFLQQAAMFQSFVSNHQPTAQSMVYFSDGTSKPLGCWNLHMSLRNHVDWGVQPYLRPLAEALDEGQPYLVVLADRHQGRILRIAQGEAEMHFSTVSEANVKHSKKPGSDHIRSQMNFQRKAEIHAHWHLKEVMEFADRLFDSHPYHYLILGGPSEVVGYMQRLLSKRLSNIAADPVALPFNADPALVLETTARVISETLRKEEVFLVEKIKVAASKQAGAIVGLTEILKAFDRDMIWHLVYGEAMVLPGKQCPSCKRLFRARQTSCNACHETLTPVSDLLELLIHRVIRNEGKAKCVREVAAARLREFEGIGALLRTSARKVAPVEELVEAL